MSNMFVDDFFGFSCRGDVVGEPLGCPRKLING